MLQTLQQEITGLIEINPEGGKVSRAQAISPDVEAGNWHLPHPGHYPWVQDFVEECASFPNGAHDDQVDAWSQGGNYMRRRIVEPNVRFFDIYVPQGGAMERGSRGFFR